MSNQQTEFTENVIVPEAAAIIGVNESTLYGWIRSKLVPSIFVNGEKVIRRSLAIRLGQLVKYHGKAWKKYLKLSPYDRFIETHTLDKVLVDKQSPVAPPQTTKNAELIQIIKKLKSLNEPGLALDVATRALEIA
ncbi:helix-turn-helix domain-containing protein [Bdellovibrio bacteriovorus]